jgi:putative ABC transport system substrate-binding protein
MKRREFLIFLGGAVAALPRAAIGQTTSKVYRVGLLSPGEPVSDSSYFGAAIIRGFARHGYALGRNLVFERRGAMAKMDRLPGLVGELLASKVDVIDPGLSSSARCQAGDHHSSSRIDAGR